MDKLISSSKAARLMAAVLAVTNESGPFPDSFVRNPDGGWGWCGYFAGHIHCFPVGKQWDLDLDSLPARVGKAVLSVLPELGEDPEEKNFVWMPDSGHPFRMPMRPKQGMPDLGTLRRSERCWKSHRDSQHR